MASSIDQVAPNIAKLIIELFQSSNSSSHTSFIAEPATKQEWELCIHRAINECNYANVEYYFNKFNYTPSTDLMATAMHTHNIRMINLIIRYTNPKYKYLYHLQKWGIGTKNILVSVLSSLLMIIISVCVLVTLLLKKV